MDIISYSDARANLKSVMDRVSADHMPIAITRQGARPVVMMDFDEFHKWQETLRIYENPRHYQELVQAIVDIKQGKGIVKTEDDLKALQAELETP